MGMPSEVRPTVEDPRVERARYRRFSGLFGTEMLTAHFVTTSFTRHTHPTYTIGMITAGVEEYTHPGGRARVGPGGPAVVSPDEVHTGHAGVPRGWGYRVFHPGPEVVEEIGRERGMRGTPGFRESGIHAPEVSRVLVAAYMAAEQGERPAASSLARRGLAMLLRSHGPERVPKAAVHTARPEVLRAQELLGHDLTDPPTLEELAAQVGMGPFALNRAFRARYGLPPHAYLNQLRADRARSLPLRGRPMGDVAPEVGFADQPHLTRRFRRDPGIPPGVYQRGLIPH